MKVIEPAPQVDTTPFSAVQVGQVFVVRKGEPLKRFYVKIAPSKVSREVADCCVNAVEVVRGYLTEFDDNDAVHLHADAELHIGPVTT